MKKIALLVCILALAMCTSAQTLITFQNLTPSSTPIPVPDSFGTLDWEHVYSVDPVQWTGAGPGFTNGPDAVIAFVGGNHVCIFSPSACKATISGSVTKPQFQAISASVSAGYQENTVTFVAYLAGVEVGRQAFDLTVTNQVIYFPTAWGNIDQLKIWPSVGGGQFGSVVFYTVTIQ